MKKISIIVVCLLFALTLAIPVNASTTILTGCWDPANYIHDITISGDVKTIRYDFSEIRYAFRYWDNGSDMVSDYIDNFTLDISDGTTEHVVACYPFGVIRTSAGGNLGFRGGALYVGDILPGSPIDFDFILDVAFRWENQGQPFNVTMIVEPHYLLYDDAGVFLDDVALDTETLYYTLIDETSGEDTTLSEICHVTGTIPADASYVIPFYRLRVKNSFQQQMMVSISVQGGHTALSVDINTILENSNQMQAINDMLSDIGNQLDGVNDKLDSIDGALNGDANIDTSISDFSGAANDINNAMQSAGTVMNAGSDSVSDIVNSSAMTSTLSALSSGLSVAFSDDFKINLCGMSFNPFALWVTVIGGFSLIALTVAYLFRKRGQ